MFGASIWCITHESGGSFLLTLSVLDRACCGMIQSLGIVPPLHLASTVTGTCRPFASKGKCVYGIRIMQSKAKKMCSLFLNQSDWSWSSGCVPEVPGACDSQSLPFDGLLRVINGAPCWPAWGSHNHCNFGLCCQQPQRAPQAVMETLLAVAAHQSDGRVGTLYQHQSWHSFFLFLRNLLWIVL